MKKLLVLISIVSLLAFAGSAFAADYDYDAIGHIVDDWSGSDSDLVGHVDGTYGSGAYAKYLQEKAAKNPSTTTTSALSTAGLKMVTPTAVANGNSSDANALTTLAIFANLVPDLPFGVLPSYTLDSSALSGDEVVIVLYEAVDSTIANKLNGKTLHMFARAALATSNVDNIYLYKVTTAGVKTKLANNTAVAAGTVSANDIIVIAFKPTTSTTDDNYPVSTSANVTFAPAAVTTQSASAVLGSSGGGCALGTSALALAVLGLFIAKRRG